VFSKILIANRGEIACRIIKTAERLGIATVAVYSEADSAARHVALADEAVEIGPAAASDSYLRMDRILEAARRTGAQAIHPGYGFLSENAEFAAACAAAGVVFIGPPPAAIRAMGSKRAAKAIMEEAGVPVVPGFHGQEQGEERLSAEAERIGYPVLLKASAGGGGKGMRIVNTAAEFSEALTSAKRESSAAFGDDQMLVEKYLATPRHIELQVFADTHGNAVHLFERDCSVQRRHQKVLEEAPAPGVGPARRAAMGQAAVAAARAVDYVGAGTVEFIADTQGNFYFMEMNTRLQVEHPVTELICGQDLVEWQLRVAAGEPLPRTQDELALNGHAIEARLYAEDAERDFLPATGHLAHLRFPQDDRHVRVDSGVRAGDAVTVHYDPMIAKVIVWDRDRDSALRRLQNALRDTQIVGVTTNLDFLANVVNHETFRSGRFDTGFIDRHREELLAPTAAPSDAVLAVAALDVLLRRSQEARASAARSTDPHSPWHLTTGWRLNEDSYQSLDFVENSQERSVVVHFRDDHYLVDTPSGTIRTEGRLDASGDLLATLDGRRIRVTIVRADHLMTVLYRGNRYQLALRDLADSGVAHAAAADGLIAPMPGKIIAVLVKESEQVSQGAPLLVLEAMKMEHTITAPCDGRVSAINYSAGEFIDEGAELIHLESK
jgi:3-methylcrotonyl-CoA carboxylase alpha subunit